MVTNVSIELCTPFFEVIVCILLNDDGFLKTLKTNFRKIFVGGLSWETTDG